MLIRTRINFMVIQSITQHLYMKIFRTHPQYPLTIDKRSQRLNCISKHVLDHKLERSLIPDLWHTGLGNKLCGWNIPGFSLPLLLVDRVFIESQHITYTHTFKL